MNDETIIDVLEMAWLFPGVAVPFCITLLALAGTAKLLVMLGKKQKE